MEEQKDTRIIWIVMAIVFFAVSIILGILLYHSQKVIQSMKLEVTESVTEQETQISNASADPVRLMDGMVQVQKDNEWVDYCSIEEFEQSDPVEAGKQKMLDMIKNNQDAVTAGNYPENMNSEFAMLGKLTAREIMMEPQTEAIWKVETDNRQSTAENSVKKSEKGNGKNTASKGNGKTQTEKGNTSSGQNTAGTATPAAPQPGADSSVQQPAAGTATGGAPSDGNASAGGSSSSGSGSSSGGGSSSSGGASSGSTPSSGGTVNTPSSGADSGNSGSTSGGSSDSGGGNSGGDSGNSGSGSSGGDGEDIGWTDDIL